MRDDFEFERAKSGDQIEGVRESGATATLSNFVTKAAQMWNDLTQEEKEAYHERARKINEKGQGDLLATMKKMRSEKFGRPQTASMQFRNQCCVAFGIGKERGGRLQEFFPATFYRAGRPFIRFGLDLDHVSHRILQRLHIET